MSKQQRRPRDSRQSTRIEAVLERARQDHLAGRAAEAEQGYRQILSWAPEHAETLHLVGVLAFQRREWDAAIDLIGRAIQQNPTDPTFHNNLGNALQDSGRIREAIESYHRALRLNPQYAEALSNLGNAQKRDGRPEQAMASYRQAIRLAPDYARAYFNLGTVLEELNQTAEAIAHFRQAVRLAPDYFEAHNNLGGVLRRQGDLEGAAASFQRTLELMPDLHEVHGNLGVVLLKQGKRDEAIACFQRVLDIAPDNKTTQYRLAALTGAGCGIVPPEYVASLFDEYADHFDAHLLDKLQYRAPLYLAQAVERVTGLYRAAWRVVDLGCGTGLCGPLVRKLAGHLIGTDLSPKMIEMARQRGGYDELRVEELLVTLATVTPPADLIVAADVLVYIGDLAAVISGFRVCLAAGGLAAFTTERGAGDSYSLEPSGRFRHSEAYVRRLASEQGLHVECCEPVIPRYEGGEPVDGLLYLLRKPTDPVSRA